MTKSLREVATVMDPAKWGSASSPISVRLLAEGHRWVGIAPKMLPQAGGVRYPDETFSLTAVVSRHSSATTTTHKFLAYNTYLLSALTIPWDGVDVNAILDELGLDPLGVVLGNGALKHAAKEVLSDLSSGNLFKAFVDIFDAALKALDTNDKLGLQDALNGLKTALSPQDLLFKAMAGAGLSPAAVLKNAIPNLPLELHSTPAIDARAGEIGLMLANEEYDIAALCEVWQEKHRNGLLEKLNAGLSAMPVPAAAHVNPPKQEEKQGVLVALASGLVAVTVDRLQDGKSTKRNIVAAEFSDVYDPRGNKLQDADAWAGKRAMRTVIDVGVGRIEIYSTHLIYGNDFGLLAVGNETLRGHGLRIAQVGKLMQFVEVKRDPKNVCMIVGDFNIDYYEADPDVLSIVDPYEDLVANINNGSNSKFFDAWSIWNEASPKPSPEPGQAVDTRTFTERASLASMGNAAVNHELVCQNANADHNLNYCPVFAPVHGQASHRGRCFDYMFVEHPTAEHSFNLDLSRVRRRPFLRSKTTEGIAYLSDHMGLDVQLVASAK